jgi:single-strand DNA-binding protein
LPRVAELGSLEFEAARAAGSEEREMYETTLTVLGRVATTVTQVTFNDGGLKASFRLASSERRFDRDQQTWVDGPRLFLGVVCWRNLADRVVATLRVGDPVIVRGKLRTREYEKDGQTHAVMEVEATSIGPDLSRCSAAVLRRDAEAAVEGDGGRSAPAGGGGEQEDRWNAGERAEAAVGA